MNRRDPKMSCRRIDDIPEDILCDILSRIDDLDAPSETSRTWSALLRDTFVRDDTLFHNWVSRVSAASRTSFVPTALATPLIRRRLSDEITESLRREDEVARWQKHARLGPCRLCVELFVPCDASMLLVEALTNAKVPGGGFRVWGSKILRACILRRSMRCAEVLLRHDVVPSAEDVLDVVRTYDSDSSTITTELLETVLQRAFVHRHHQPVPTFAHIPEMYEHALSFAVSKRLAGWILGLLVSLWHAAFSTATAASTAVLPYVPLKVAARSGHVNTLLFLLESLRPPGVPLLDVHARDTLMSCAVSSGSIDMARLVLETGPSDSSCSFSWRHTGNRTLDEALECCIRNVDWEDTGRTIAAMLCARGADIRSPNVLEAVGSMAQKTSMFNEVLGWVKGGRDGGVVADRFTTHEVHALCRGAASVARGDIDRTLSVVSREISCEDMMLDVMDTASVCTALRSGAHIAGLDTASAARVLRYAAHSNRCDLFRTIRVDELSDVDWYDAVALSISTASVDILRDCLLPHVKPETACGFIRTALFRRNDDITRQLVDRCYDYVATPSGLTTIGAEALCVALECKWSRLWARPSRLVVATTMLDIVGRAMANGAFVQVSPWSPQWDHVLTSAVAACACLRPTDIETLRSLLLETNPLVYDSTVSKALTNIVKFSDIDNSDSMSAFDVLMEEHRNVPDELSRLMSILEECVAAGPRPFALRQLATRITNISRDRDLDVASRLSAALVRACGTENISAVRILVNEFGGDINRPCVRTSRTPLAAGVMTSNVRMIDELMREFGAVRSTDEWQALTAAIDGDDVDVDIVAAMLLGPDRTIEHLPPIDVISKTLDACVRNARVVRPEVLQLLLECERTRR